MTRLLDWLDQRNLPIAIAGLSGSAACLLVALAALAGCGAVADDSGTDGVVANPCAELQPQPEGCE